VLKTVRAVGLTDGQMTTAVLSAEGDPERR
jgi:hypothetical protein